MWLLVSPGFCGVSMQVGAPAEEDLKSWGHHSEPTTIPDSIMRSIGTQLPGTISFVFSNQVSIRTCQAAHECPCGSPPCCCSGERHRAK